METIPLYIPKPLVGNQIAFPLWPLFPESAGSTPFASVYPASFFKTGASLVEPKAARAIVLPNTFTGKPSEAVYIQQYVDLGKKLSIPVFLFCLGDLTDTVPFDSRVYVFRQSVYRSTKTPQDIVIPTLTEDVAEGGITLRAKKQIPTVSFCGQGGYKKPMQLLKYHLKIWRWRFKALGNPSLKARIVGVYWRRKMMRACSGSTLVKTLFIVRHSFSGARRTIELDPAQARKEFWDSIANSDFVLAPKGDGNYSNRFLEALSMGRIPVLLDTDTVLPLEDGIAYDKVMVRVPMERVRDTPKYIRAWYDKLSEEEWKLAQVSARKLYARVLRIDSYFAYFFKEVLPALPTSPQTKAPAPARHR